MTKKQNLIEILTLLEEKWDKASKIKFLISNLEIDDNMIQNLINEIKNIIKMKKEELKNKKSLDIKKAISKREKDEEKELLEIEKKLSEL